MAGGRVQVRDDLWGKDKPQGKKHRWWRETQAGVLQTYQGQPAVDDPTPDVPECLKDPLWVVPKLNEIHDQHAPAGSYEKDETPSSPEQRSECLPTPGETKVPSAGDKTASRTPRWSGGDPLVKTIVATRRGYDHLGLALAGEAFGRGFNKAKSKAFRGDGLKVNRSL